jgi:DNA-binding transcriptional LysR family regulator
MLLSQPTVSEHIRSLETELEQKLVDRLGKEVEPTPAGRLLYRYASKILKIRSEAIQALASYGGTMTGRITMGCSTIPGTYILPELIGRFRRDHPSIRITLRITSSRIIADKVLAGEHELGVIGARWNEPGLDWHRVFADELVLAVHPDHPWTRQKVVPLAHVSREPFILREADSGTRRVFAGILEQNGLREANLQEVAEIGSTAAVRRSRRASASPSSPAGPWRTTSPAAGSPLSAWKTMSCSGPSTWYGEKTASSRRWPRSSGTTSWPAAIGTKNNHPSP